MRTAGALRVFAIACLAAAAAFAGDDGAKPPKKQPDLTVRTEEEWFEKLKAIDQVDSVSIKKSVVLEHECARSVVKVCVKIRDIRATKDGVSIDVTDILPPKQGVQHLDRDSIRLPAEDGDAVREWKKWDRLVYRVKPKAVAGKVTYERLVSAAADLDRVANPGPEYPTPELPLKKCDTFREWLDRYVRACESEMWKAAWPMYAAAVQSYFPITATCADASGSNRLFELREVSAIGLYGLCDSKGVATTQVRCIVADPQVAEALTPGKQAELYLHVLGSGGGGRDDLEARHGRFRVEVTFGRLAK